MEETVSNKLKASVYYFKTRTERQGKRRGGQGLTVLCRVAREDVSDQVTFDETHKESETTGQPWDQVREEHSRQKKQLLQRPWGGNTVGVSDEDQQRGHCAEIREAERTHRRSSQGRSENQTLLGHVGFITFSSGEGFQCLICLESSKKTEGFLVSS